MAKQQYISILNNTFEPYSPSLVTVNDGEGDTMLTGYKWSKRQGDYFYLLGNGENPDGEKQGSDRASYADNIEVDCSTYGLRYMVSALRLKPFKSCHFCIMHILNGSTKKGVKRSRLQST